MAVLKLHGTPFSTAAMRALAALYEKELDFELVPVDMKAGQHKSEAFLALNVSLIVFFHDRKNLFYCFMEGCLSGWSEIFPFRWPMSEWGGFLR